MFILCITANIAYGSPLPLYTPTVSAPEFSWKDAYGRTQSLSNYKGDVIFLNFWATWCAPCKIEMPAFNFLQNRYDLAGFKILAINVGDEPAEKIQRFLQDEGLSALDIHIDDTQQLTQLFGTKTLPTTYVINRSGQIVAGKAGLANWMSPDMFSFIEDLLKEPNPYGSTFSNNRNVEELDLQPVVRF